MDLTSAAVTATGTMEPKRLAAIAYFVLAFVLGMFLTRVVAISLSALRINDAIFLGIPDLSLSLVVGFAIAIAIGIVCWLNPRVNGVSLEIATELKRVTWPTFGETRVATIAVIIASLTAALILFCFDFISSKVMTEWMPGLLRLIARI